jgi:hypothetical protein
MKLELPAGVDVQIKLNWRWRANLRGLRDPVLQSAQKVDPGVNSGILPRPF